VTRLTDEDLTAIAERNAALLEQNKKAYVLEVALRAARAQLAMVNELRERRQADLSAEDKVQLRFIQQLVAELLRDRTPTATATDSQRVAWRQVYEANTVLDKLLAKENG
jgi:hypothetical protein